MVSSPNQSIELSLLDGNDEHISPDSPQDNMEGLNVQLEYFDCLVL